MHERVRQRCSHSVGSRHTLQPSRYGAAVRPRVLVFLAGLGLCAVASIPLWLIYAAVVLDGAWAFLAGLMALFTAPFLGFWLLGPRVLMFAIRGIPVQGGNFWRWRSQEPVDDQTIDAEFERRK